MEIFRLIFPFPRGVAEEVVVGKDFKQLGYIQYQHADGGSQPTRQPTVQMSMEDVQGYLRVPSGARVKGC